MKAILILLAISLSVTHAFAHECFDLQGATRLPGDTITVHQYLQQQKSDDDAKRRMAVLIKEIHEASDRAARKADEQLKDKVPHRMTQKELESLMPGMTP